jgi:hypothetical protein
VPDPVLDSTSTVFSEDVDHTESFTTCQRACFLPARDVFYCRRVWWHATALVRRRDWSAPRHRSRRCISAGWRHSGGGRLVQTALLNRPVMALRRYGYVSGDQSKG